MSTAMAQSTPPANTIISNGNNVFQSTHIGGVVSDSPTTFPMTLTASMTDSLGNSTSNSASGDAAPSTSSSVGPITCEIPVANYTSGSQVTFTVTTTIQGGGVSATDTQSNTLTVP